MSSQVPWCDRDSLRNSVPWYDDDSSGDEELILLYSATSRSSWVHPINERRGTYGEFHHLFADLASDEERFKTYFRLNPEQFDEVLALIEPDVTKNDTNYRSSISAKERLAICLRYLATGDTYTTISFSYRVGISTVSQVVKEVCDAIWNRLQPIYMPAPDENLWRSVARGFQDRWNFPHCIGTIDGKHVRLQAPPNSGSSFYNYKKYFSTVLLGLVDSEYKFIAIDTGSYGKESDGGIFSESVIGKRLCSYSFAVPKDEPLVEGGVSLPYVVVGDEGFPLKRFIMRPFPKDRNLTEEKRICNYRICRCRRVVENAFGILAQRWRLYFRPLQCRIDTVQSIIKATTVLHNYLCSKEPIIAVGTREEIDQAYTRSWKPIPRVGTRGSDEAIDVRNHFVQYFNSAHGSVPWQWEHL